MNLVVEVLTWAGQGLLGLAIFVGCWLVVDIVYGLIVAGWRR